MSNIVDFENQAVAVCSNKGDMMTFADGIMQSHFLKGTPEWVAITAGGGEAILFFEEISTSRIVKDDLNPQRRK